MEKLSLSRSGTSQLSNTDFGEMEIKIPKHLLLTTTFMEFLKDKQVDEEVIKYAEYCLGVLR